MKKIILLLFTTTAVLSLVALKPSPSARPVLDAREDSLAGDRAKFTKEIMDGIKGREKMSADSVFKNVKIFKGKPAEQLLKVMENGWSKALGVSCNHCHDIKDWANTTKHDHEISVEMVDMMAKINNDMLKTMLSYSKKEKKPTISCMTCHNGATHPGRPNRK